MLIAIASVISFIGMLDAVAMTVLVVGSRTSTSSTMKVFTVILGLLISLVYSACDADGNRDHTTSIFRQQVMLRYKNAKVYEEPHGYFCQVIVIGNDGELILVIRDKPDGSELYERKLQRIK